MNNHITLIAKDETTEDILRVIEATCDNVLGDEAFRILFGGGRVAIASPLGKDD